MAEIGQKSEKPVKKTRGRRGDGMIYLHPDSAVWWVKIPVAGNRPVRESTGKTKEGKARAYLKIRRAATARHEPIPNASEASKMLRDSERTLNLESLVAPATLN